MKKNTMNCPVMLLRDTVMYPYMILPLLVGREKSIKALNHAMETNKKIVLLAQVDANEDNPGLDKVYRVGTYCSVVQFLKLPDGTIKALVEGEKRVLLNNLREDNGFLVADLENIKDKITKKAGLETFVKSLITKFDEYIHTSERVPVEVLNVVSQIEDKGKVADIISSHLNASVAEKQGLLETANVFSRLEKIYGMLDAELDVIQVEKKIHRRVKKQMEKSQRDYYLNEQIKAIQKELGDDDAGVECDMLAKKIQEKDMPKDAKEKATNELKKLRHMGPMSSESAVIRTYIDWILDLPWNEKTKSKIDLKEAEKILNEDHYGLDKVKERIIEQLAVQKKTNKVCGTILCLVGPPGVGKTSLGESIARATGRNFVRASLGGVKDEAEIRGHRRTYVGALPGRILQNLKKAKSSNPLFLLDEIDKLSSDYHGDPASALLEVLDPAQNKSFNDHYIELDYDLSDVMFITTANSLDMPRPLLDRMEIIRIAGYTEEEKLEIAKRHLIKKERELVGLKEKEISISDEAIIKLIRYYTSEAGVRNLDRKIAELMRKATKELVSSPKKKTVAITDKNLKKYLGVTIYSYGLAEKKSRVGVTTGLAWTQVGGDILYIEAVMVPGKGSFVQTGKLGDVMKESITAAETYVRAHAAEFGIRPDLFFKKSFHVHVPEGATPKDGPSAGVAMCTSLVSAMTGIPVSKDIAMTGEITILGEVLPIGGLKEKLLAALRAGIKTVLIPKENKKDLEEMPKSIKDGLKIIPVSDAKEVLKYALVRPLTPIEWTDEDFVSDLKDDDDENKLKAETRH
ncbi:MAG: endopeptidase La [Alphaproteobacteria bacterium]|nr:endopeptidase La [Alphaproteobacteria bacterium]